MITGGHSIPLYLSKGHDSSGLLEFREIPANLVKEGDLLLKADLQMFGADSMKWTQHWRPVRVVQISKIQRRIRYLLTSSDTALINGIASYTFSTRAGVFETLPFKMLYYISPWIISSKAVGKYTIIILVCTKQYICQIVHFKLTDVLMAGSALQHILESPILKSFESFLDSAASLWADTIKQRCWQQILCFHQVGTGCGI